jgi:hypothetical protein
MQFTLESNETAILKDVLATILADLRAEIGKTEDFDTRQELHQREAVLRKILAQIDQG